MENEIRLVIVIEVQSGKSEQQLDLYRKIRPLVLAEEGCLEYEMNRVEGTDENFVLIERWASESCLAAHDCTEHMKQADAMSPSFRAGPATVFKLSRV